MKIFTNHNWQNQFHPNCYSTFYNPKNGMTEYVAAHYSLNPLDDQIASENKAVFDPKKAAAMYFWYKSADKTDKSIVKYFKEYKACVDDTHQWFNSNYGVYAYKNKGLKTCIDVLLKDKLSRQACFCINNNNAMSPESIDKLCTNVVHFLIRNDRLIMIVQMRSSNMLTLLPYDFFIFSVWYAQVFNKLIRVYHELLVDNIVVQVMSLHRYSADFNKKQLCDVNNYVKSIFSFEDMCDHNFENILEEKLLKFLNK